VVAATMVVTVLVMGSVAFAEQEVEVGLVHLQDRFRVMGYRKIHENSDLCTFVLR
jgi:hypothetical protein